MKFSLNPVNRTNNILLCFPVELCTYFYVIYYKKDAFYCKAQFYLSTKKMYKRKGQEVCKRKGPILSTVSNVELNFGK